MNFEAIKLVSPLSIAVGKRIISPTPKNIAVMADSLKNHGQLTPIVVMPVTTNTYRLIAGATRLEAAIELGWEKIRVEIATGTELQFEAHEVLENLDRRDLTREQRAMLRKRKREIELKMFEQVRGAKGGRGKKGGVREAARQAGVSQTTAVRVNKLNQNQQSGSVSDEPAQSKRPKAAQMSVCFTWAEREFINDAQKRGKFPSLSDAVRAIVRGDAPTQREWIAEKKQHQPDADHLVH